MNTGAEMAGKPLAARMHEILGGDRTFGRSVSTEGDLVPLVRSGFPYTALESLTEAVGLSVDLVSAPLAISEPPLRGDDRARLSATESDRLLRLARVVTLASEVFGDMSRASAWLVTPNRALGNEKPLSQTDTDVGVRQIEDALGRMAYGVYG